MLASVAATWRAVSSTAAMAGLCDSRPSPLAAHFVLQGLQARGQLAHLQLLGGG